MPQSSIGVFDSGVGGLTVLKVLAKKFPNENFLYLGDTARLPYGTKSPDTIRAYSEQVMDFLIKQKVKAIIIACNSASSQVFESEWKPIPVYGVIKPGAEAALRASKNLRIGVLGTRATIESEIYPKTIHSLNSKIEVFSQACPLFVPLAEEGWIEDPITDSIAKRYLEPLLKKDVDTLVLGCTHYPILKTAIQKVCGPSVSLVDSSEAISNWLQSDLSKGRILVTGEAKGSIKVLTTDLSSNTELLARRILENSSISSLEKVDLLSR